jgi:Ca2+-dependent lipid-binding protein
MLKKGNKLYSILTGTCPRCHEEGMYLDKNPYHLGKIYKMQERCSSSDLKYKIEPSFFYGAMYVSYGLGIAFAIAAFVISKLIVGTTLINTFIAIVGTLITFMPIIMRISRNIWINLFITYNPNITK